MPKPTPLDRIAAFLRASGWSKTRLAAAVGRTDSAITKVLAGLRELSPELAIDLQIATAEAARAGDLPPGVRPLRAADLHPKVRAVLKAERSAA